MSLRTRLFMVASFVLGTGCSSYGLATSQAAAVAPFAPAADAAKICVMRAGAVPAPFFTTVVYDNNKLVGATKDWTYFCYLAEPGKHVIVSDGTYGRDGAARGAKAGNRYYLEQVWLLPGFRGHALSWIDESAAKGEIQDDEYALLTEVPGTEALPGYQPFAPAAK